MRLRKKNTQLNIRPEEKPKKRPFVNVGSFFYFFVFFTVLLYAGYQIAIRQLFFSGTGQVILEKTLVGMSAEGHVATVSVSLQRFVAKGDPVARIIPDIDPAPLNENLMREILRRKNELAEYRSRKNVYFDRKQEKARQLRDTEERFRMERALELSTRKSRNDLETLQDELGDLSLRIREVSLQIDHVEEHIRELEKLIPDKTVPEPYTILSPVSGIVTRIFAEPNTFLQKDAPLISVLPESAPVHITAFFDLKRLKHLKAGKNLLLILPDNIRIPAQLTAPYAAGTRKTVTAETVPDTVMAAAELILMTEMPEGFWLRYDEMLVRVKVPYEWVYLFNK